MQGHDFIFCLVDSTGTNPNFWGLDANGKAKLSAKPYFLDFSPDGWMDISIQNIRNKIYFGVDRSVTIPFGYVEDGATILKTIFYTFGPETPVFLKVCRQQLDFVAAPGGILEFTAGQSPFTPNGTAAGTITGTPGETVHMKMNIQNGDPSDSVVGFFDSFNFNFNFTNPNPTFDLIVPPSGIINFSVHFTQVGGSSSTAGMELVNGTGQNAGEYGFWYKQIYCGQIDFSVFNHKGSKVTITTLEDGLPKFLKANENTTIELPMNVPEAINWKADGIILHNKATWFLGNGQLLNDFRSHVVDLQLINKEVEEIGDAFPAVRTVVSGSTTLIASNQYFFKATVDGTIELEYDFEMTTQFVPPPAANPAGVMFVQISHVDGSNTIVSANTLFTRGSASGWNGTWHISGTLSIPVLAGQRLFLWTRISPIGTTGDAQASFTYGGLGIWNVAYKSRFPTTYIKALRPGYIFKKLMEFVTEGEFTVDESMADYYFGVTKNFNKPFSPGNSIRGFTDAVMKISLKIFFNFWDCFDAVGIVAKANKVIFDRKKNLIDFTKSISLGEVSNLAVSFNKDMAFNELSIGYPEIKNEAGVLNGNDEFNCGFLFSLGATLSPKRIEKVPEIKASCYEIELIRIATNNRTSTDYKNDNEIYCIHILNTEIPASGEIPAHFQLDRTLNAFATGLLEPETVFNIELSPKRNLYRNGDWLRSCLMLQDSKVLKYQSSDKNNKLITTVGANVIEEKKNVLVGSLDDRFFVPVNFIADTIVPFNLLELLDENPLQLFDFDFYGVNYKGIMEEATISPGTEKEQSYKLLSTATNDLKTLIDYYG